MATEIVTLTWCDQCLTDDGAKPAPADGWQISITVPGGKPQNYDIDLCEVHAKPFQEVLTHLDEIGRVETIPCPYCPFKSRTEGGLATHITRKHPEESREPDGEARAADVEEVPCPECERTFKSAQAVLMHRVRRHGYQRGQDG